MLSAPPVQYPVGRFDLGGWLTLVLAVGTAVLACGWWWMVGHRIVSLATMTGLWWLALALAVWCWQKQALPPGVLNWDGEGWWYQATAASIAHVVGVRMVADAGHIILLTVIHPQGLGGAQHTCLLASSAPASWHGLRCACVATLGHQKISKSA